ncbi:helix-turn-helix transcriptional regulator [Planomonospora alba]|uniref:Helix-turn-helix transcriptional regulator n=1 Tax=Planomonospora alba TaxID=161354 RepID=A0ABP6NF61_9ACTN
MPRISPNLRLEKLGDRLRRLREEKALKLVDVAQATGISVAKASRMENGANQVSTEDVERLLDLYEADDAMRIMCLQLAEQARLAPWWKSHEKGLFTPYVSLETEARRKRSWQPNLVPGLLQTPEYAKAAISADQPWEDASVIALRVRARMARKWVLTCEDPLKMHAIIGEEALRRPVGGPEVMATQIDQIVRMSELANVTVQVMPCSVGAHAGMAGAFLLLSMTDNPTVLFREVGAEGMIDHGPRVEEYEKRWAYIAAAALPPEETRAFLTGIKQEVPC